MLMELSHHGTSPAGVMCKEAHPYGILCKRAVVYAVATGERLRGINILLKRCVITLPVSLVMCYNVLYIHI